MKTVSSEKCYCIFGYGSIIWKTSFPYTQKIFGYVEGYGRRFWQGSTDHRGTAEKPGRVVTLIQTPNEKTWGVAYRICESDWETVVNNLNQREIDGYLATIASFISITGEKMNVWIYIAPPNNQSFLGDAEIHEIAQQILESKGLSGSNIEYLLNLAQSLREIGPFALDHHTSQLEKFVIDKLNDEKIDIN